MKTTFGRMMWSVAAIASLGFEADGAVIQLTSPSQLSSSAVTFSATDSAPVGTVFLGPSQAFDNFNNLLTFSRGSGAFEVDQAGYDYGGTAFANGTPILFAGGFQGPGDGGPVTLSFAAPIVQFATNIEEFNAGTVQIAFTAYDKTTNLGTFFAAPATTGETLSFVGLQASGSTGITSIVFDDTVVNLPNGMPGNNLGFGNLAYVDAGVQSTPPPETPEPPSTALLSLGLLAVALSMTQRSNTLVQRKRL